MNHITYERLGFSTDPDHQPPSRDDVLRYIALKLIANGLPLPRKRDGSDRSLDAELLLETYHKRLARLHAIQSPADQRIEGFLQRYFDGVCDPGHLRLPTRSIVLDRHGLARELSLPIDGHSHQSEYLSSYRVRNGVLHNPLHDRRTTKGTFHITEGGLPIPHDKKSVPKTVFAALFRRAMAPPESVLELPFSHDADEKARSFVSLLLRPLVCPEVPKVSPRQTMEVRFFAPGSLVANLDFVESIFGNAGDPYLDQNDAGLDTRHWTGHTGCVILAPHLNQVTKKEAGLPHVADATKRQVRDGMCWESEEELYNEGSPFKLTCRDASGVIVTLITDSYFGYCKKEVKTQISFAANLLGNAEEEHAGGAIAFASFNLGTDFAADSRRFNQRSFADVARDYADQLIDVKAEGYGVDRQYPSVIYIPEDAVAKVSEQTISWQRDDQRHSIPLLPEQIYLTPSGYKLQLMRHENTRHWHLTGTLAEGVLCHKPCTVSGGGKSEISKPIADYVLHGPIFVADLETDLDQVQTILDRDYSDRWREPLSADKTTRPSRRILNPERSLGSVIKLLTPSLDYSDEYNAWLSSIPSYIYALVFAIKRMHRGDEQDDWRGNFSVDIVNGVPGHELKYKNEKLLGSYLRVGLIGEQSWRTFKVRQDFAPAQKLPVEDDITASTVVPMSQLDHLGSFVTPAKSCKFVENCEYRLFQRPDDAIHRGLDKQAEADLSRNDNFIVNFEPLSRRQIQEICNRAVDLSQFTKPMQRLMKSVRKNKDGFAVCSATPRLVDGKPSLNPRYLQTRQDLMDTRNRHVAEMGVRLYRAAPADEPIRMPVHSILVGRRNNPPDPERGFRALSVYNPLHYQELPELFMDFISALTGKSPSTTGAGSEGALTKGPFNALTTAADLNSALTSYLLTGVPGFSTPAGYIGAQRRVDHDISFLIPEVWCRLSPEERDPEMLIREELLERVENFEHNGVLIPAARLGYRITSRFVRRYLGRVFDNPDKVLDEYLLRPETQDLDAFADGVLHISEAHQRVAKAYFEDGSIKHAIPPLQALLGIMAHGDHEGLTLVDPEFRNMFTVDAMLDSEWYEQRLAARRKREASRWKHNLDYLRRRAEEMNELERAELQMDERIADAEHELDRTSSAEYTAGLRGYLGGDPYLQ